jgi:hypothetical protein
VAGLRRHRVDLLHRDLRVVEQLGRDEDGRWAIQPLKTRSGVRLVALPAVVVDGLDEHLRRWAGRGREGFVFTSPDGGHIDPDNFRTRIWTPAIAAAGLARCASTTSATPPRHWRSPPEPTSRCSRRCSATPRW